MSKRKVYNVQRSQSQLSSHAMLASANGPAGAHHVIMIRGCTCSLAETAAYRMWETKCNLMWFAVSNWSDLLSPSHQNLHSAKIGCHITRSMGWNKSLPNISQYQVQGLERGLQEFPNRNTRCAQAIYTSVLFLQMSNYCTCCGFSSPAPSAAAHSDSS